MGAIAQSISAEVTYRGVIGGEHHSFTIKLKLLLSVSGKANKPPKSLGFILAVT